MRRKRGSTLTELVIVMAVVEIMSIMVVSFTLICNSWVTIGAARYQTIQDSGTLSRAFRDFVAANDSSSYTFAISEDSHELIVMEGSVPVNRMVFDEEAKTLTFTLGGEPAVYEIDEIDDVTFSTYENPTKMIYATVDYTYMTPGKKVQEQHKSYKMVVSLRSARLGTAEAPGGGEEPGLGG